ncbi:MAG: twin-arginine translocase subunit TatC [Verrucomicrobiota bacterium]
MYLLKKVFQLRDQANPDMEKPFLEHLEDLRVMITRMVLTLIVAMIACFAFQKQVMDLLLEPVDHVWTTRTADTLPEEISVETWETIRAHEKAVLSLSDDERTAFVGLLDETEQRQLRALRILRAAKSLSEDQRTGFLDASIDEVELRKLVDSLLERDADPDAPGRDVRPSTLRPGEGFMLSMKLAFFSGIVVSFPLLLLYLLQFVVPGLHDNERKMLWPAMAIGFGLFLAGVLFAYLVVLPRALVFFSTWDANLGISNDWRIGWYISFATQFTLLFGLSFELPVLVMVFVKLGLLSYEMMSRTRSYAVLAIVIIAAIITPTSDIVTLSLMAVPMYLLYETCIWLAYLDERKRRREEDEEDRERMSHLLDDDEERDENPVYDETEEGEEEDRGDDDPDYDKNGHDHRD